MHRLYTDKYGEGVKNHYYAKIFNEEFNLHFGYPKVTHVLHVSNFVSSCSLLLWWTVARRKSTCSRNEKIIFDLLKDSIAACA